MQVIPRPIEAADYVAVIPIPGPVDPRHVAEAPALSRDGVFLLFTFVAMLVGLAVRLEVLAGGDFPAGDGGMFYVMVRNLLAHNFVVPATTTYNHAGIPFAYPPLGFYAVAGIHTVAGWSILAIMRWFPLAVNVLSVGAFGLLARSLIPSRVAALAAVFIFALLPEAIRFEIYGGGITRAPGMLFALLALTASLAFMRGSRRAYVPAAALIALTVLSHLEWTWFVAYSLIIISLFSPPRRVAIGRLLMLSAGAAIPVAPWLVDVVMHHGLAPFGSVLTGSSPSPSWYFGLDSLLSVQLTQNLWFPLAGALTLLGIATSVARRAWLLPGWLLILLFIDGRAYWERAAVLIALLAGLGVDSFLASGLHARIFAGVHQHIRALILGIVVAWGALSTLVWDAGNTIVIPATSRSAMSWVSNHTPLQSTFLLIDSANWGLDFEAEWFPALANRPSLNTVQGFEWVHDGFMRRLHQDSRLQLCVDRDAACLERWMDRTHIRPTYVWVGKHTPLQAASDALPAGSDCCWPLRTSLMHDPRYTRVYDGPSASIFERHV